MNKNRLHIVSFNVPYPPNYGGVIDVFFKIKALSAWGIEVILHTFHYGREQSPELESVCAAVHYYPRKKFYQTFYSSLPYIVASRKSDDLINRLANDHAPILFEGLHTCFYLKDPRIAHKQKLVRMHNIEWDYYRSLGKAEQNFFVKFYLYSESRKLKWYEDNLQHADEILAISPLDRDYLSQRFKNIHYLPAFHPFEEVSSTPGIGNYALYHGNLKVQENNQAAMFLVKKVFDPTFYPLKIAGHQPTPILIRTLKSMPEIQLITDPTDVEMQSLIREAQVNILPTFQSTGIKLKLLNALFNGRHCVVNPSMVMNTGLESFCVVAEDAKSMKSSIEALMNTPWTSIDVEKRKLGLMSAFSNVSNAKKLISILRSS